MIFLFWDDHVRPAILKSKSMLIMDHHSRLINVRSSEHEHKPRIRFSDYSLDLGGKLPVPLRHLDSLEPAIHLSIFCQRAPNDNSLGL